MKKAKLICAATLFIFSAAVTPAHAADACESVICLYGKMTGNSGGDECKSPEKEFFNIIKKNKYGFLPNKTFNARNAFLGQCKTADPAIVAQIMKKFGKVKL
ncbi:hypothetical protein JJL91_002611 [Salmonella enterica]|nr:hypothetical protein [Escherichia coli]EGZ8458145.1 hypothetical protein [Salmonella enterica]